ncbi:TPA: zinc transporter [Legionella pneumophila]|uniref:Transporter, Zip family n=2 Tax=Legionella pneumophila TaxID=446 RepID=Q5ZTX3_LEGPH|nr:ZIP family metal transporter [Legionella pneumophila]AAU28104.1 transporter, Zip family [Legionella pneumophila subsp. pneumophila str. Philadelphia 1]AGH53234.1 Zinc transporter, ZIP family [Legionella pneumophila subsp. pneumophila LPE509]AGN14913.1 Zip family protein [Legionella pneumophila subsp. pneumophila str. Thunder Bay]AMQ28301.1 zinc transporter [Legionella pneumophila subsp. pneumophila]AOU05003.1 zinc transporter [Legionella pneumophila]
MLSATSLKIIFAVSIFIVILIAGWYPFKKRLKDDKHIDFPIGETLATGVFLGAALLHMLPESNTLFKEMGYNYPFAFIITGVVFLIFLWFEHLGKELYHHHDAEHPAFAILAWAMLSVHSLMLGAALGFTQYNSMIIMLFLAIITHKWAESLAIAIQLNKSSMSTRKSMVFFFFFSLMTPLGIYFGWYFGHGVETNSLFDPILIAASAGTFLYLGTLHGLERCVMVERCCNLSDFSFVIIGFLLMASVAIYV